MVHGQEDQNTCYRTWTDTLKELNFKSSASTISPSRRLRKQKIFFWWTFRTKNLLKAGIEPTTLGFSVQCSTTELFKLNVVINGDWTHDLLIHNQIFYHWTIITITDSLNYFRKALIKYFLTDLRKILTEKGLEPLTLGLWFQYSTIELFRLFEENGTWTRSL